MSSVAQPTPQNSSSSFSPSPPVPLPLDTLARENSPRGESTATEQRAIEDRPCPEPSKPPNPQEDLQEAGGVPSIPGNSPAFPEVIDPFGLAATAENADAEKVEIPGFDAYKRGERCPSWALHQPRPRAPPASNLLAGPKKPSPLSPRHRCPGHKTKPGADAKSRRPREKARERSMCCYKARPVAKARRHRERARAHNAPRRCHQRAARMRCDTARRGQVQSREVAARRQAQSLQATT